MKETSVDLEKIWGDMTPYSSKWLLLWVRQQRSSIALGELTDWVQLQHLFYLFTLALQQSNWTSEGGDLLRTRTILPLLGMHVKCSQCVYKNNFMYDLGVQINGVNTKVLQGSWSDGYFSFHLHKDNGKVTTRNDYPDSPLRPVLHRRYSMDVTPVLPL